MQQPSDFGQRAGPILGKAISLCVHRGSSASRQQPGGCPWGAPLLSGSFTLPSTGPCKTSVNIILLVYSQQVMDADSVSGASHHDGMQQGKETCHRKAKGHS